MTARTTSEAEEDAGAKGGGAGARPLARGLTLLHVMQDGAPRLAARTDEGVLDVARAAELLRLPAPATIDEMLQGERGAQVEAVVKAALRGATARPAFREEEGVRYGPVVTRPEKIVCVGLNYRKHAEEIGAPIPKQPVLFNKYNNTLNHHGGTIRLPAEVARNFDYEVELVIVMGRTAKDVSVADAHAYVAGYCTGNDFSARDLQMETGGQWMAGKTSDHFAPLGPYLVTADQVDPDHLAIECRVNGETRQASNTSDFIFDTRRQISYISRLFTLRPGDLIFTGTPQGVIQGKPVAQRVWLKAGDQIACSVERLGELRFSLT